MLKICLTVLAQLPIVAPRCPPSGQAAKQYGEVSEWLKEHAWKVCIRQRIGGSNPPLTAIFEEELALKCGLFFRMSHAFGGDENPRPGFDNWRSQLDRLRAKRVNPPGTTGAASPTKKESPYKSTGLSQPFLSYSTSLPTPFLQEMKPAQAEHPLHPYAPPASNPHF